jgi:hypothetical protein
VFEDVAGPGAAFQAFEEAAALADAAAVLDQAGQQPSEALVKAGQFVRREVFQLANVEPDLEYRTVGPDIRAAQVSYTEKLDVILLCHVMILAHSVRWFTMMALPMFACLCVTAPNPGEAAHLLYTCGPKLTAPCRFLPNDNRMALFPGPAAELFL